MTLRTNARIAGFMFLFYIAAGITHMVLFAQATAGAEGAAETLASIARNATLVRVTVLLTLCEALAAVTLAVTLFGLTRDLERDLSVFALCCRLGEGVLNAVSASRQLELLSVATGAAAATGADAGAANALGAVLLQGGGLGRISAICFAAGSVTFSYIMLRARSIPGWLAWLGVISSVLWLVGFPLMLTGVLAGGPVTMAMYIPMAVFEVTLALWLIIKGVSPAAPRTEPARA